MDVESEFAAAVARWQNFESLVGSIAATLLGLLFVAASIRPALFDQTDQSALPLIAADSMEFFILVILMSLVFQIPDVGPGGLGVTLAITAAASSLHTLRQLRAMRRILNEWGPLFLVRRIVVPALGYAILLVASVAIYRGQVQWLLLLAISQIVFLFIGTRNAWDLLIRVGRG